MKLPKSYFENITTAKYREYLKLLPDMKKENTRIITMLIFTFAALSFFGVFAINPTLTTIVDLRKKLEDNTRVHEQLQTKISNLSTLQQKYSELTQDLPIVLEAIPESPSAALGVGQVQSLAEAAGLEITSLRVFEVQLAATTQLPLRGGSFSFMLEAEGNYDDMLAFTTMLTQMNRIVTIETMGMSRDPQTNVLTLNVRGKEYFK